MGSFSVRALLTGRMEEVQKDRMLASKEQWVQKSCTLDVIRSDSISISA